MTKNIIFASESVLFLRHPIFFVGRTKDRLSAWAPSLDSPQKQTELCGCGVCMILIAIELYTSTPIHLRNGTAFHQQNIIMLQQLTCLLDLFIVQIQTKKVYRY